MIETERLLLRNWRQADFAEFVRTTNTPAVMRWLGGVKEPEGSSGVRLSRITDEEIAERIGATRESVNRKLSRLRELGVVRRAGRDLVVLKRQKLRDLCRE